MSCTIAVSAQEPRDSGLEVRVDVSLMFLDVEALDADGNPLPGLSPDDFSITLNSKSHPIYSVDDLCACGEDGEPRGRAVTPNFVLYFDFSQLRADGREHSLREAERWLAEVKRPDDLVLLVAYSSENGLSQLMPWTTDAEALLEGLRRVREDSGWADPFPAAFAQRLDHCGTRTVACHYVGLQEYRQAERATDVLLHFLTRLEAVGGRKRLLLFQQTGTVYPAALYSRDPGGRVFLDGTATDSVPDLEGRLDELAGTAAATGTVAHVLTAGAASSWTREFSERLARSTGGTFNGGAENLRQVLDAAGRGCDCMYRIGVEVPKPDRTRVVRVSVGIGDQYRLPGRYRLQVLSDEERWFRSGAAVLLDPESAVDVRMAASVTPAERRKGRWTVKIQVALDPESLSLLPVGDRREARWEVGALLAQEGGRAAWEMIGVSQVRCSTTDRCGTIVHERRIEGVRPGSYELRAFVRDRWTDTYGGARTRIALPRRGETSPNATATESATYLSTALPLRSKRERGVRTAQATLTTGLIPKIVLPAHPSSPTTIVADAEVARPPDPPVSVDPTMADEPRLVELELPQTGEEIPAPPEPAEARLAPTDVKLEELLPRLARAAERYRDHALRFTCEETIDFRQGRNHSRFDFEYIYAYDDNGLLTDYRVKAARTPKENAEPKPPEIVDLSAIELPIYATRAYSSIFVFSTEYQQYYDFETIGEEAVLGRRAVKLNLTARLPYVEAVNDWIGSAWIDRETDELLRFSGHKAKDQPNVYLFEHAIERAALPRVPLSTHTFDRVEVDFEAVRSGLRLPSRVRTRRTAFSTTAGVNYLRSPPRRVFEIVHAYDNYRIYRVESTQQPRE